MKRAMSVLGPIDVKDLGFTSMHEHVTFQGAVLGKRLGENIPKDCNVPLKPDDKVSLENVGPLLLNSIMTWDALIQDDEDVMVGECEDFKNTGGNTILEVSVPGIQLDTAMIGRISKRSGVNIIVSTGFYTWDSWPEEFRGQEIKFYRNHMLNEIKNGVQGTDIKPGCLKIALNDLNQMEENALRAAAQVSNDTGMPLNIHPCSKVGGDRLRVLKILLEEKMEPGRIVFSHSPLVERPSDFRTVIDHPELIKVNTEMEERLMDHGVYCNVEFGNPLGFEMMHRYKLGDLHRMAGLYKLIDKGYASNLTLGTDVCGRTMLRRGGALGYLRLTTFVIPTLRDVAGVSDYAIRQMTVVNPMKVLAFY